MRHSLRFLCTGTLLATLGVLAVADDARDEAIKRDHKQIEGTWQVVALVINGDTAAEQDARKLTVVNGTEGTWALLSEGQEIAKGTSTIDPSETPKTINFTMTEGDGKGNQYLGIYELGANHRKLCFAPAGEKRPTDFYSGRGSQHILVDFEREQLR